MLREEGSLLKQKGLKVLDLLLTCVAFGLAYELKQSWLGVFSGLVGNVNYLLVLLTTLICCAVSYDFFNLHKIERRVDIDTQFRSIFKAVIAGSALAVFLFYVFKYDQVSRLFFAFFMIFDLLLLLVSRMVIAKLGLWRSRGSMGHRHVLVIGSLERARDLLNLMASDSERRLELVGCLDPDPERVGKTVVPGVTVLGTMDDYESMILDRAIDEVVFAMPLKLISDARERIGFAEKVGVNVRVMPDWQLQKLMFQPEIASITVEKFAGMPTLALSSVPRNEFELFLKYLFDRVAAACGLMFLAPLFVALALVIKFSSKGPVFFRQERSGLNGRLFTLLKFRTMVENAEELKAALADQNEVDGPVFKIKADPRITMVGRFLRRTSLDELPQLINILRGEMSLVGPRPPIPAEVKDYQPWQRRRLSMRPGLTCIWQVSGRNNITFDRWMELDLEYIDHWSIGLDARLLFRTVPAVLFGSGQ
ncbi:sugar transferase [Deltaproteobacteria bacterium IMCC39524]|nr:sugar transferase [Deltaproteobacteria bacterium IMCC39524]